MTIDIVLEIASTTLAQRQKPTVGRHDVAALGTAIMLARMNTHRKAAYAGQPGGVMTMGGRGR
ncbi:MAG: hypothetical protein ABJH07_02735 [Sedimentitalea sp.]|uniref:hypothetical protein n=1 Tax=Rhodobacterales TaxID=204455 RepID=UPI003298F866